jgi:hypothetical protein
MTNPTSNFGWQMPTPTDLVTDLPADFEVFGQAVDTDFADLLGGTTGQILSKASATDLDFTWITNDVGDITAVTVTAPITGGGTSGSVGIAISGATTSASGAVQLSDSTSTTSSVLASTPTATKAAYDLAAAATPKSLFTAKGSIVAASAASTPANLTVGSNGSTIMADSTVSNGLRYVPIYAAGRNKIINGDMSIAQRGTSVSVGASAYTYTLDRFKAYSTNTATTVSQNTSAPTGFSYSLKLQRPNANTGTNALSIVQIIETANSMALQDQAVTLSFYVKKGANYSGGNIAAQVLTGTGSDQGGDPYSWTGLAVPINDSSYSPTTGFVRVSYGGTISATAKEIAINIGYTSTGTAGADDALYITGLQLEIGSGVTPFTTATNAIGGELALCQRYYYRTSSTVAFGALASTAWAQSATLTEALVKLPVTMRVAPTTFDGGSVSNNAFVNYAGSGFTLTGGITITTNQTTADTVKMLCGSTGMTAGQVGNWSGNASGYLGFGAEL